MEFKDPICPRRVDGVTAGGGCAKAPGMIMANRPVTLTTTTTPVFRGWDRPRA
ncbi:hypothetical protein NUTIK01_22560 [Novosphingobium sp. IK01]|uniref:Uncharacterized protein n=1 Tax=Novosphingobium pituita TaxID=3056842 RepID=A0ABQ6P8B4_9SPHN|nr:hypothetical protein NUTIK01_22560 [Novosphingobium sp. IK01]